MEWLVNWWDSLTLVQQCFACVAIPATLLLLIQTVMVLFGLSGQGGDSGEFDQPDMPDMQDGFDSAPAEPADIPDDGSAVDVSGIRLFTVRGFIAFFAVGGWLGIALIDSGMGAVPAALLAALGGLAALVVTAYLLKWSLKMQENGTIQMRDLIARTGTVYIPVPPSRTETGKITLQAQGQFMEFDAVTDEEASIPTGTPVQVIGLFGGGILVVRPLSAARE